MTDMTVLTVVTSAAYGAMDVTDRVVAAIAGWSDGPVLVSMEHTTAGLVLGPADDGQMRDYERFARLGLQEIGPYEHHHPHDGVENGREHLLSTIVGTQVILFLRDGKVTLGRWQRVLLFEFDGPKDRHLQLTSLSAR